MADVPYIVDQMREVVAKVQSVLAAKNFGRTIYYRYGHPKEVAQVLKEITAAPKDYDKKFPMVYLITDTTLRKREDGLWSATPLILICNYTDPNYKAEQRTALNFKPVLRPIANELIRQIERYPGFTTPDELTYDLTDLYFYGSKMNDKNPFGDYIDAVQLSNISINLTEQTNCSPTSNI